MTRYAHVLLSGAVIAGLALCPASALADRNIPMEKLPVPVKQVIERELRGGTIDEIELETRDDIPVYEVEIKREGRTMEFKIRPDGVIVQDTSDKLESAIKTAGQKLEGELTLDQVPPVVRKEIEARAMGGKIDEIEREKEDGVVLYEVEIEQEGRDLELRITEDGRLLPDDDDEVTTAAADTATTTASLAR